MSGRKRVVRKKVFGVRSHHPRAVGNADLLTDEDGEVDLRVELNKLLAATLIEPGDQVTITVEVDYK